MNCDKSLIQSNGRSYDSYLSSLGCDVLSTLLKIKEVNSHNDVLSSQTMGHTAYSRVGTSLNYGNSKKQQELPKTPNIAYNEVVSYNENINTQNKDIYFDANQNVPPTLASSNNDGIPRAPEDRDSNNNMEEGAQLPHFIDGVKKVDWKHFFDDTLLGSEAVEVAPDAGTRASCQGSETDHPQQVIPKPKHNKHSFQITRKVGRKKTYTSAVKLWLHEISADGSAAHEASPTAAEGNQNVVVKKRKIKQKKSVQSKLANKDGVMKFEMPKKTEQETAASDGPARAEDGSARTENENILGTSPRCAKTKTAKGRKSKFVAPIKCESEVSDVELEEGEELVEVREQPERCAPRAPADTLAAVLLRPAAREPPARDLLLLCGTTFYYFQGYHPAYPDLLKFFLTKTIIGYDLKELLIYLSSTFGLQIEDLDLKLFDIKVARKLLEADCALADVPGEGEAGAARARGRAEGARLARAAARRAQRLRAALHQRGMTHLFDDIEMRVLPIIADMEYRGVCVDVERLQSMERRVAARLAEVAARCERAAGRPVPLHQPALLAALLYDELALPPPAGERSTAERELRRLAGAHPLPALLLEHRRLHKAHATFLAGVLHHVRDGRLHPTWEQTAAATGRIACLDPNLQAIPKTPFPLTLSPDDQYEGGEALSLRSVYVAAAGCELLAADFRQVECRVVALAAGDARLQAALAAGDLFAELAALWLRKPAGAVSPAERARTKRVVYASLYGAGGAKLADLLDLPYDEALSLLSTFNRTFPSLRSWQRRVAEEGRRRGGRVVAASGRARTLGALAGGGGGARAGAERQAGNFVVQGAAADACKAAMAGCAAALRRAGLRGRLLLQVHDELVWELRRDHLPRAAQIIQEEMEGSGRRAGLAARLPVALAAGRSWGELRALPPPPPSPHSQ